MTDENDLNSLLSQLQKLDKSNDYLTISNTLDLRFHSKINAIIEKWISKEALSNEEKKFFDIYSRLQSSFVEYCFLNSDTTTDAKTIISKFNVNLFKRSQIDALVNALEFIRDEPFTNRNDDDSILVYITRMIDARSIAYRFCSENLPEAFLKTYNDVLRECLTHQHAKNHLHHVKSMHEKQKNLFINNQQKFFIGCCTYATASFDMNVGFLKDIDHNKYIYLLVKYVRIMLSKKHFEDDQSVLYCLRGSLAVLTNCVPTANWIHIINKALANEDDDDAQQANPFNIDLFVLLIDRLLGSTIIRDKAKQLDSHITISLVDVALIFLNKWFDTSSDLDDDDDDNENNQSSSTTEPNQILRLLRSETLLNNKNTSQIIAPYIHAKYDRLRLMAISTLSAIMSNEDFKDLEKEKLDFMKEIVDLIFHFLDRAMTQDSQQYKGIKFERLLCYLRRFLVQDNVKKTTLPYISKIIDYAKRGHLSALKILRKISTNPDIHKDLLANVALEQFLEKDANNLYSENLKRMKYVEKIRENLKPKESKEPQTPVHIEGRQAFISYSHKNKDQCDAFVQALNQEKLFTKIWRDTTDMEGNIVDTITQAIRQSKIVFFLLSNAYSQSDDCRGEWEFAHSMKIKVHYIFIEKEFRKATCDWVLYYIRRNLYYRVYTREGLDQLIKVLHDDFRKNSPLTNNTNSDKPRPTSASSKDNRALDEVEELKKHIIAGWTSDNIQTWCRENKLDQWCEPLRNYNGRALLELNKILKTDTYLQHISTSHRIMILDVIRFKCELDKLVSETTAVTPKPSTRKSIAKRRASKTFTK